MEAAGLQAPRHPASFQCHCQCGRLRCTDSGAYFSKIDEVLLVAQMGSSIEWDILCLQVFSPSIQALSWYSLR